MSFQSPLVENAGEGTCSIVRNPLIIAFAFFPQVDLGTLLQAIFNDKIKAPYWGLLLSPFGGKLISPLHTLAVLFTISHLSPVTIMIVVGFFVTDDAAGDILVQFAP
ncbi:hypothetical protein BU17DRAFT_70832 [Hysterangium stoloniferum]|nr:hypothetical protein BU17DRAFT_70832 [Hysterangium stoloniferum]